MKWFKHLSHSNSDEKLAELLSECGLEGYGFWWLLMEVVAAQCVDEKCSAAYSLPQWSRLLYSHHNRVSKYLGKLEVMGVVTLEYVESRIRVTIPNLLKYRDEYSRKSGLNQESVPPKNKKENKEGEIEKKKIKSIPPSSLLNLWNEVVGSPTATAMGKVREAKCRSRLSERNLDGWREVFQKLKASAFLTGENERGWRADFDWVIGNDGIALKILEGKYDNKPKGDAPAVTQHYTQDQLDMVRRAKEQMYGNA